MKIYIFSVDDHNTTASYFKSASKNMGFEVVYLSNNFDVRIIQEKDIFIYIDPVKDFPFFLEKIKCKTVAYFIDVHLALEQRLIFSNFFDFIFIAQKNYINFFNKHRKINKKVKKNNVFWLPLACDPKIHFKKKQKKTIDVSFIGQVNKIFSEERYNTINKVLKNFKTNNYKKFYKKEEIGKIYSSSKIVFNKSINKDLNMRFFEGLCSGALLVTDELKNNVMGNLFSNRYHYISYYSSDDAIKKINYYLKNFSKRELIAKRGKNLVIKSHTYLKRLNTILQITSKKNSKDSVKISPIRKMSPSQLSSEYAKVFLILRKPFRVIQLMFIYNFNFYLIIILFIAICRYINVIFPFTPNAIKNKINRVF